MSIIDQLSFAVEERPPYFTADVDIQVHDDEEDEWKKLRETGYSIEALLTALKEDNVDSADVQFADESAKRYLSHLRETEIDPELHHEDKINRERLNALADAGYTAVEDLLGTTDAIDIGRETGIDRDIISSIATNNLDGFSSGQSFGGGGPLADLSPKASFEGWKLTRHSPNLIRWVSKGRFNVTISPVADGSTTVVCNAPESKRNSWYRKGRTIEVDSGESLSPQKALERAHQWLAEHEIIYEDDLATHPHIGASTRDYLALGYEVVSESGLQTFAVERSDEFDRIFGANGEELRESLGVTDTAKER